LIPASTFEGDERIRVFCALRLPDPVLDGIVAWQESELEVAGLRIVRREQLHVTLAFLGRIPAAQVRALTRAQRSAVRAAGRIELGFPAGGYRETRTVGMLLLRDVHGTAAALAEDLHDRLERLGLYERERRAWLPHVTVARFRKRLGLELESPDAGSFTPSEAAVYHSVLRPSGAQYQVIESVALGG